MSVHGVNRLRDIMRKMGIDHELRRIGAVNNSRIKIGPQILSLWIAIGKTSLIKTQTE